MTEYNEGDLVEAVKGNTVIRGPLVNIGVLGRSLCLKLTLGLETDIIHLEANGYTITVIEKALPKVVLPTQPGIYQDAGGRLWMRGEDRTDISPQPFWWELDGGLTGIPVDLPLTPLEPASETAKKVLKALDDFAEDFGVATSANRRIYNDGWNAVAIEFGVEL